MKDDIKFGLAGLGATALTFIVFRIFSVSDQGLYVAGTALAWYATGLSFVRKNMKA